LILTLTLTPISNFVSADKYRIPIPGSC